MGVFCTYPVELVTLFPLPVLASRRRDGRWRGRYVLGERGGENALFCLGVEARGDFVQQKDGGVSRYGTGDGEELPLAL